MVGHLVEQNVLLVLELFVLVYVAQSEQQWSVDEDAQTDADVQPRIADVVDDTAGDHRTEGVRERVRDVGDSVDATIDGHVTNVDEIAERWQDGRVDERDAETVYHDRENNSYVPRTEWN